MLSVLIGCGIGLAGLKQCRQGRYFYRATACNATHGITKAFLSICLSGECVHCDRTKETCTHFLTPYERSFILVAAKKNGWCGTTTSA